VVGSADGNTPCLDADAGSLQGIVTDGNSSSCRGGRSKSARPVKGVLALTARPRNHQAYDESLAASDSSSNSLVETGLDVGNSSKRQGNAHGAISFKCAGSNSDISDTRHASGNENVPSRHGLPIGEDGRHSLILEWRSQMEAQTLPDAKSEGSLSVGSSIDPHLLSDKEGLTDHESMQPICHWEMPPEIRQTSLQSRTDSADEFALPNPFILSDEDKRLDRILLLAQRTSQPLEDADDASSSDESHGSYEDRWAMRGGSGDSSSATSRSESAMSEVFREC